MANWEELLLSGLGALGLSLSPLKVSKLALILKELVRWNQVHNLTSIDHPRELVEVEILDSLAPLVAGFPGFTRLVGKGHGTPSFVDVGCGAGFPLLPLVVAVEGVSGVGVDSSGKRLAFVSHAARTAGVSHRVRVVHSRAHQVKERFPLALARALASPPKALEMVASLVEGGGHSLLFLSCEDAFKLQSKHGGQVFSYTLPFSMRQRALFFLPAG